MDRLTQDKIDRLLGVRKIVLDNIKWNLQSKRKLVRSFQANVISEVEDVLELRGYYNERKTRIWLTLKYQNKPLIEMHYGRHRNPEGTNPERVNGWHKHPLNMKYGREYAYEVNHEFTDDMPPEEKINQFFIENNLHFIPGKKYSKIFHDYRNP